MTTQVENPNAKSIAALEPNWCTNALAVQDACNLSGVVHAFSRILSQMCDCGMDTDARNRHPASILFATQIAHLTGTSSGSFSTYSDASNYCRRFNPVV